MNYQERFNTKYKIDPTTGCWNWIGSKDSEGYIKSLTNEEFNIWTKRFEGKSGRALANLTTAMNWRTE